jgi:hypothetical protein
MSPAPESRIGDVEREAALTALGEHYAAGRLTKDEYDERSDLALRARTHADLTPLFGDLPHAPSTPGASARDTRRPVQHAPWQNLPLLPILAAGAVLVAVISGAWWVLFILAGILCCGPRRHWHRY